MKGGKQVCAVPSLLIHEIMCKSKLVPKLYIHSIVQVYSTVVVSQHVVAACSYFNTVRLSVVLSGQLRQPRLLI